jgi:hypothetical protein
MAHPADPSVTRGRATPTTWTRIAVRAECRCLRPAPEHASDSALIDVTLAALRDERRRACHGRDRVLVTRRGFLVDEPAEPTPIRPDGTCSLPDAVLFEPTSRAGLAVGGGVAVRLRKWAPWSQAEIR